MAAQLLPGLWPRAVVCQGPHSLLKESAASVLARRFRGFRCLLGLGDDLLAAALHLHGFSYHGHLTYYDNVVEHEACCGNEKF